ncbi:neurochondrin homolog [Diachasma alloeum]|uniref:neurochondrin homolog n=1 Tax=Diachasma alloeum TaxID=454923 RepID=UPI0010FB513D|nr:neurochondrin homolog [Diachasma alloeum]
MALYRDKNDRSASITTIFFDLDNTLIETRKGDSLACKKGVTKCASILKTVTSDSEKFAALFMVTKLVDKNCSVEAKKLLFEAIGSKFLKKLLLSNEVPVDCPPQVCKSVALSILSAFCVEPELASHQEMIVQVPGLLEIVSQSEDDASDDSLLAVSEAYTVLQAIAQHSPGQKALLEEKAIPKMCEIYSEKSFQTDEALNILVTLVSRLGAEAWDARDPGPFHGILNKIALDFETDHSERKFELCPILQALISSSRKEAVADSCKEESWPQSLHKGLSDILCSKIGKSQRDPALKLAAAILELLGAEWTLMDEEKPKVLFLMLIQLASIEVRMQLEGKQLKTVVQNGELITACFVILEICLSYITTDQLDLEQKEKQSLYTALKGAFSAVIGLLGAVSKMKELTDIGERVFVCAMVRVLAAWLAQETSAMRPQVYAVLPFMMSVANDTFYANRNRKMTEKARAAARAEEGASSEVVHDPLSDVDVLRVMLPALCYLAVEEEARKILLKHKQEEVLFECLSYHWTIVHYKKPPVPRAERLKALKEPQKELDPKTLEEMKDSRAAMVSICNVLMNITVLEAKLVEQSATFVSILKFIFNNLPELKQISENLVLHGHLAVLGLLLLKQQAKLVKKNDFSICRYIQATIRFLWDAYVVDESSDPTELVVAMFYKEHWMEIMELWFLGMQTMAGVFALIPWLTEFAIESGWIEGMIEILKKVRIGSLPPNVKSAYEDLLCHLVKADSNVVSVLKKNGALTLTEELTQLYNVPQETASRITANYLKQFRKCPDNPAYDLDTWRESLWAKALGKYSHVTGKVYERWLYLRYCYLKMPGDTVEMLVELRKKYLLGLITNGPSCAQREKVRRLELARYFDIVLVSGDLPWEKPQAEIFQEACRSLGVRPSNCIMIGDKLESDIKGGIESGLAGTVWIPLSDKTRPSPDDPKPDYTIKHITDLMAILNKRPGAPELEDSSSNASDGS